MLAAAAGGSTTCMRVLLPGSLSLSWLLSRSLLLSPPPLLLRASSASLFSVLPTFGFPIDACSSASTTFASGASASVTSLFTAAAASVDVDEGRPLPLLSLAAVVNCTGTGDGDAGSSSNTSVKRSVWLLPFPPCLPPENGGELKSNSTKLMPGPPPINKSMSISGGIPIGIGMGIGIMPTSKNALGCVGTGVGVGAGTGTETGTGTGTGAGADADAGTGTGECVLTGSPPPLLRGGAGGADFGICVGLRIVGKGIGNGGADTAEGAGTGANSLTTRVATSST